MTTKALYALYVIEMLILVSIVYARHQQAKTAEQGAEMISQSKRQSDAELIRRKTKMDNILAMQEDQGFDEEVG